MLLRFNTPPPTSSPARTSPYLTKSTTPLTPQKYTGILLYKYEQHQSNHRPRADSSSHALSGSTACTRPPPPALAASTCSDGQVAYHDSTQGLICKSLASILGSTTDTKVCPAGEYLMGFDTGAGDDTDDGTFRCRPDAQGVSGGVNVSCERDQYLVSIISGSPNCLTLQGSVSTRLSSAGKCEDTKYLRGFDNLGRKVCLSMPRGVEGTGGGGTGTTPSTGGWTQTLKISDNGGGPGLLDIDLDEADRFGIAASLSGNLLAVSVIGPIGDGSTDGAVYLFEKQTNGTWSQVHKFSDHTTSTNTATRFTATRTDVDFVNNDVAFGISVSLSGNLLAVGANLERDVDNDTRGSVHLFEKQTNGTWSQVHKFSNHTTSHNATIRFTTEKTDIRTSQRFGQSVSLSGNLLAVGANTLSLWP